MALEKLKQAKEGCNGCSFAAANAEMLPFKSNSFDFVLCTEVLEHVPDWKKALQELMRVSKKRVLVTVPLEKGLFWRSFSIVAPMRTRGHLHRLDSGDIGKGLGKGWKLVHKETVATPSRRINRAIGKRTHEKAGFYSLMLLEKA